jgi:hypothetical protein
VTAITIYYFRLVAVDHRQEWINQYERAYGWLKLQLNGDEKLEMEVLECARKLVVERYQVDKDAFTADESFVKTREHKVEIIQKAKEQQAQQTGQKTSGKR